MPLSDASRKAMFAKLKKGDFVRLTSGFEKGKVGQVIETKTGGQRVDFFVLARLPSGGTFGARVDSFEKVVPTTQQRRILELRQKLHEAEGSREERPIDIEISKIKSDISKHKRNTRQ